MDSINTQYSRQEEDFYTCNFKFLQYNGKTCLDMSHMTQKWNWCFGWNLLTLAPPSGCIREDVAAVQQRGRTSLMWMVSLPQEHISLSIRIQKWANVNIYVGVFFSPKSLIYCWFVIVILCRGGEHKKTLLGQIN